VRVVEILVLPVFVLFLSLPVMPRIEAFKPAGPLEPVLVLFSFALALMSEVLLLPLVLVLVLVLLLPKTAKDDDASGERVLASLMLLLLLSLSLRLAVERVLRRSLCIAAACGMLCCVGSVEREKSSIISSLLPRVPCIQCTRL
jgi:hypothetical protein